DGGGASRGYRPYASARGGGARVVRAGEHAFCGPPAAIAGGHARRKRSFIAPRACARPTRHWREPHESATARRHVRAGADAQCGAGRGSGGSIAAGGGTHAAGAVEEKARRETAEVGPGALVGSD